MRLECQPLAHFLDGWGATSRAGRRLMSAWSAFSTGRLCSALVDVRTTLIRFGRWNAGTVFSTAERMWIDPQSWFSDLILQTTICSFFSLRNNFT